MTQNLLQEFESKVNVPNGASLEWESGYITIKNGERDVHVIESEDPNCLDVQQGIEDGRSGLSPQEAADYVEVLF